MLAKNGMPGVNQNKVIQPSQPKRSFILAAGLNRLATGRTAAFE